MSEVLKEAPKDNVSEKKSYKYQDGTESVIPFSDFKAKAKFNSQLSIFHQQVKQPTKNGHVDFTGKKGRQKYDYVTLQDLIKAVNEGLKGTGMTWTQEVKMDSKGIGVQTVIKSDNGYQEKYGWLVLPNSQQAKEVGSALTYLKRYSLGTAFGVNSEPDDDTDFDHTRNNSGQGSNGQSKPSSSNTISSKQIGLLKVTAQQFSKLFANSDHPKSAAEILSGYLDILHVQEIEKLNKNQASQLIKKMTEDEKRISEKLKVDLENSKQEKAPQEKTAPSDADDPFAGL